MTYDFNADEIFEIAERIEENGAKFYRKAADTVDQSELSKLLLNLAKMEDDHQKTFADLRSELAGREDLLPAFDPQGEAALYLRAFADGHVFDLRADPAASLADGASASEILRTAIALERDSIVFYLGLKELVPERLGQSWIDDILREERSHVVTLSIKLKELQ